MPEIKTKSSLLILVQTGIGLGMVGISWLIIWFLPMLKEVRLPTHFNLKELIAAVLFSIAIFILIRFGLQMKEAIKPVSKKAFPTGYIINLVAYLISTLIGYLAYKPIIRPYLGYNIKWIYPVVFLILAVGILLILGYIIFSSAGGLVEALNKKETKKDDITTED